MTDAVLLERVLAHIHNWFVRYRFTAKNCTIQGGTLPASVPVIEGQWYRVEGSSLNDGLHLHPATDLMDETFSGTISLLAIPKPLLATVDEIAEWVEATNESDKAALASPYQSESFGGYSYTVKSGSRSQNGSGGLTGWQAAFAPDLNAWRKIS